MSNYKLIILKNEQKLNPSQNYGLLNKENGCIEARAGDMPSILAAKYHYEFLLVGKPWEGAKIAGVTNDDGDFVGEYAYHYNDKGNSGLN